MHHKQSIRLGSRERPALLTDTQPAMVETSRPFEPGDLAGNAVSAALETAVSRITAGDPDARRGDKDAIHRLRTATRRLRSELRAFDELVDRPWRERTEGELKWLARLLGGVRNLDILLERLRKAASKQEQGDPAPQALAPLFPAIQARRDLAEQALNDALDGDRYRSLLEALTEAAECPPLLDRARLSCRAVLPHAAADAWRRLKKAARGLRLSDPIEDFHEVRKRAKRVRYTSELVAPVVRRRDNRAVRRFIRLTTRIQDVLGEHQDAIDTTREIEQAIPGHANDLAFLEAAERLLESQRKSARAAREEFFEIWDKVDRKKARRWMKTRIGTKTKPNASREPAAPSNSHPIRPAPAPGRRSLRNTGTLPARPHR
jgi:CHAD domain-containing protein